jgi:iron complex outermembrane recepter protein
MTIQTITLAGSALALCLAAGAAQAQSSDVRPAAADDGVQEIIVTAQKRNQSLKDVGLTIQAIGAEDLAKQRITSLADIAATVPGLDYAVTQVSTPVFTLRGVGFYENALAAYPTVSVYMDEVPLQFPAMTKLSAFDLERIEVLKGPQGTLFGQNSTGGAVSYIAAKPTSEFSAGADLSYGRFDTIEANGFVSGPLSPTLSARIAGHVVHSGDWQQSYTRDDSIGQQRVYAGRMLLDWTPAETLKIAVNLNGWKDKSDIQAAQYLAANPQQPAFARPDVLAYPVAPGRSRAADWSPNFRPRADNRFLQGAVRADYDISDDLTLTSISAYGDYKTRQVPEGDGQAFNTFDFTSQDGYIRTFTQEVRLANSAKGAVRWVLGANYERSHVYENLTNDYRDSSTTPALGLSGARLYSDQQIRNYAGFGNIEADLGRLTVKAGARYTQANRRSANCSLDNDGGATNAFFTGLGSLLSGVTLPPLQQGQCFTILADNRPGPIYYSKLNENNLSWRVGIDYKPSRDVLLYANVSKGYKAGSIPTTAGATYLQYAPVKQESVLAYEAGVKASMLDRKLQAEAAVYYYDYRDKQLRGKQIDPVFGLIEALVNIPKSRVLGGEIQLTARPARGLTFILSGTYTDAQVRSFIGVNAGGQLGDFSGAAVPYTPKYQAAVTADYEVQTSGPVRPFIGGDLRMRSDTTSIIGGDQVFIGGRRLYNIEGYATLNLRAGVRSQDGRWQAMVWGKNVTNSYYWNNVVAQSDVIVRYAGRPATYGFTVGYKY